MKLVFKRKECIGAGECAALSPGFWKMSNDGKADLAGAKVNNKGEYELELSDEQAKSQKTIVSACPSGCIRIEK